MTRESEISWAPAQGFTPSNVRIRSKILILPCDWVPLFSLARSVLGGSQAQRQT